MLNCLIEPWESFGRELQKYQIKVYFKKNVLEVIDTDQKIVAAGAGEINRDCWRGLLEPIWHRLDACIIIL